MSFPIKTALVMCVTFLLSGCLQVKDFGQYWQKSVYDPCIGDILMKDVGPNLKKHVDPQTFWHVLDLGAHHFLLMKSKTEDIGGDLVRFDVDKGEFITFNLNQKMLEEFEKEYPNSGVSFHKSDMGVTASIPLLDEEKAALIQKIAVQDKYWEQNDRQPYNPNNRNDCRYK